MNAKSVRSFRVDTAVWDEAVRVAALRGESLSVVLRRALVAYVKKGGK